MLNRLETVKDLLISQKHKPPLSVSPYDTVAWAVRKMSDHNLGAIPVMDAGEIVGLFSERDYARKLLLYGKSSAITPIHDVMVRRVLYVTPDYLLEDCLALMTQKHIRHLPVLDERGKVLALISLEDVVEAVLEGKEFMISELTRYVTGSPLVDYSKRRQDNVRELVFVPKAEKFVPPELDKFLAEHKF